MARSDPEAPTEADVDVDADVDSSRPRKRQRVSVACDQCKRSKYRCDGRRPTCSTCADTKVCTYTATVKRRGLASGYVRSLEALLGLVFEQIDTAERTIALLFRRNLPAFEAVRDNTTAQPLGLESALSRWRASTVNLHIDTLLSGGSVPPLDRRQQDEAGAPAHFQLLDRTSNISTPSASPTFNGQLPLATDRLASHSVTSVTLMPSPASRPATNLPSSARSEAMIDLPANFGASVDSYFRYTHCWLPFIERTEIYRAAFAYSKGPIRLSAEDSDSAIHAVLWAILAHTKVQSGSSLFDPEAERAYKISKRLIPAEMAPNYDLGHVQALLILCLVTIKDRKYVASWFLHAVALLLLREIDAAQTERPDHPTQTYRRTQTWAACFVLDALLAAMLKRSPQMSDEDLSRNLPLDENGLEEWEPWTSGDKDQWLSQPARSLSVFNQLLQLARFISEASKGNGDSHHLELSRLSQATMTPPDQPLNLPHTIHLRAVYELCALIAHHGGNPAHGAAAIQYLERMIQLFQTYIQLFGIDALPATCEIIIATAFNASRRRIGTERSSLSSLLGTYFRLDKTIPGLSSVRSEVQDLIDAEIQPFASVPEMPAVDLNVPGSQLSFYPDLPIVDDPGALQTTSPTEYRRATGDSQHVLRQAAQPSPMSRTSLSALPYPDGILSQSIAYNPTVDAEWSTLQTPQPSTGDQVHLLSRSAPDTESSVFGPSPTSGDLSLLEYFAQLDMPSSQGDESHFAANLGYGADLDLLPSDFFLDDGHGQFPFLA